MPKKIPDSIFTKRNNPSKKHIRVEMCCCNRCGEMACAAPNTAHAVCRGFRVVRPLPAMFRNLKKNPGNWVPMAIPEVIAAE